MFFTSDDNHPLPPSFSLSRYLSHLLTGMVFAAEKMLSDLGAAGAADSIPLEAVALLAHVRFPSSSRSTPFHVCVFSISSFSLYLPRSLIPFLYLSPFRIHASSNPPPSLPLFPFSISRLEGSSRSLLRCTSTCWSVTRCTRT